MLNNAFCNFNFLHVHVCIWTPIIPYCSTRWLLWTITCPLLTHLPAPSTDNSKSFWPWGQLNRCLPYNEWRWRVLQVCMCWDLHINSMGKNVYSIQDSPTNLPDFILMTPALKWRLRVSKYPSNQLLNGIWAFQWRCGREYCEAIVYSCTSICSS